MDEQSYIEQIDQHVETGNFHAAINIAISGLNACRKENDSICIDRFLDIINSIYRVMAMEFGSESYQKKLE